MCLPHLTGWFQLAWDIHDSSMLLSPCEYCIQFSGQLEYHFVNILCFIYPFVHWWIFELIGALDCYRWWGYNDLCAICVCVYIFISFGYIWGSVWNHITMINCLENGHTSLSEQVFHFTFLSTARVPVSPYACQHLVLSGYLM